MNQETNIKLGKDLQISINLPELYILSRACPFLNVDKKVENGPKRGLSEEIPNKSGVYFLLNNLESALYIGKSINIRRRIYTHLKPRHTQDIEHGVGISYKLVEEVAWLLIEDPVMREIIETAYLNIIPTVFNRAKIEYKKLFLNIPECPELKDPIVQKRILNYHKTIKLNK